MEVELEEKQDEILTLAHKKFLCTCQSVPEQRRAQIKEEVLQTVRQEDLSHVYEHLCDKLGWTRDEAQLERMRLSNEARLKELEDKLRDAEENLGETEIRDALRARADYLARIGDVAGASKAYQDTEDKTASAATKVDLVFKQIRLLIFYDEWHAIKKLVAKAKQLCEEGADWEHKNKLKVYTAVFHMYARDFNKAAELFLDSIATFTTTELFAYSQCIFYAVITSIVALDRVTLKKQVVDSPEILAVIGQVPHLSAFLNNLYQCKYKDFFRALVGVMGQVQLDMFLQHHLRYYMREVRVVAYSQFLESYKSVTLDAMATAFDVSLPFLDEEISNFIVAGRLNAKIDKVAGVIETNRPDAKNHFYQESIKKGDLLLNRIQKLSKVIDVE